MTKNIRVLENSDILEVVLNRPEQRNSFHAELIKELTITFKAINKRTNLRAVILRGEGKVFCAGADLAWMQQMAKFTKQQNKKDSEKLFEMFDLMNQCPHLLIALVQGAAFGGALGFIACCDIVIADAETQMCFSEVKLGLVPAVISHFVLKKVNVGSVLPLMMTGRIFTASEAHNFGFVHTVCKKDEIESQKVFLLKQMSEAGPEAVRATKALVKKVTTLNKARAKAEVCKVIAARRVSKEGQEGLKSFFDKRAPAWKK